MGSASYKNIIRVDTFSCFFMKVNVVGIYYNYLSEEGLMNIYDLVVMEKKEKYHRSR